MTNNWTYEENYICCQEFIRYCYFSKYKKEYQPLLSKLTKLVPNKTEGSLRMKIQNIKQIAEELGVVCRIAISPLKSYSKDCMDAFVEALKNHINTM